MNDLEKEVVREKKYEENRRRMNIVKRNLLISRIYNIYVNLAVTLISAASMYIWVSYTSAGIKMVHILSEEVGTISFPWFGATFFIAPILLILSFVSDVFLIRKLSRISQIVYILLCIFTVLEIFLRFEPMKPSHIFILLIYSVLGFWSEDFAIRSYKEMDLLKDEEGYPEFNYLLEADKSALPNESEYVIDDPRKRPL